MVIDDISGKGVSALVVFSKSIKALQKHLTDQLKLRGTSIKDNEIFWVLTVPAIWSDNAKQFMRASAVGV